MTTEKNAIGFPTESGGFEEIASDAPKASPDGLTAQDVAYGNETVDDALTELNSKKVSILQYCADGMIGAGKRLSSTSDGKVLGIQCKGMLSTDNDHTYYLSANASNGGITFGIQDSSGTTIETHKALFDMVASDLLVVEDKPLWSGSYPSISGNSYVDFGVAISKQGYTALGIVGYNTGNGAVIGSGTITTSGSKQALLVKYINAGSDQQSFAPSVKILWGKS